MEWKGDPSCSWVKSKGLLSKESLEILKQYLSLILQEEDEQNQQQPDGTGDDIIMLDITREVSD